VPLKLRSSLLGVALLAGALAPVAAPGVACAASSAALVVSTGNNDYTYCVELGGSSVNGVELIQRAGSQHGLQYKLGYGGRAVCMLANVGASGSDCFGEHPYFWGYWQGDGSGGWKWSGSGAANITVRAGDVNGWSWGTGDSGSSHPAPVAATYESVCGTTPSPEPTPPPDRPKDRGPRETGAPEKRGGARPGVGSSTTGTGDSGGGSQDSTDSVEDTAEDEPEHEPKEKRAENPKENHKGKELRAERSEVAVVTPSPSETPVTSANPAGATAPEPETPVAALAALAATVLLAAFGVLLSRRRDGASAPDGPMEQQRTGT